MGTADLIQIVLQRMRQLGITQAELAAACDLSQPHLSKVLAKKVKLAKKTEARLAIWIKASDALSEANPNDYVRSLAAKMEKLRPARRMQIMELLRAIERVIET